MTSFKRIYLQLNDGDKTKIALRRHKSVGYISKITRIGGEADPFEKAIGWYADIAAINPIVADQAFEYLSELVREIRAHDHPGTFHACAAASEIISHAAETVTELLDGGLTANDAESVLRLMAACERVLAQIREAQAPPKQSSLRFDDARMTEGRMRRKA